MNILFQTCHIIGSQKALWRDFVDGLIDNAASSKTTYPNPDP